MMFIKQCMFFGSPFVDLSAMPLQFVGNGHTKQERREKRKVFVK